jgi:hypothetical protein
VLYCTLVLPLPFSQKLAGTAARVTLEMGSYLTLVNDTNDAWQCKVGLDLALLGFISFMLPAIVGIALLIGVAGVTVPLLVALHPIGLITITGVSASMLVRRNPPAALPSINNPPPTSVFALAVKASLDAAFTKKGYVYLSSKQHHRWGKMSLSLWQQGRCAHIQIVDIHTVHVEMLSMRPIFSGATANANQDYYLQSWLDKKATTTHRIVAKTAISPWKKEVSEASTASVLVYPNGTVQDARTRVNVEVANLK